jgi:hypothetical protein
MSMNRREWMQKGATFALGIGLGERLLASTGKPPWSGEGTPAASQKFPPKFLWGAFAIFPNAIALGIAVRFWVSRSTAISPNFGVIRCDLFIAEAGRFLSGI